MAVALSQLRVEATLDSTAYVAGANAKAAADAKMVQSGDAVAGSLTATDQKLSTTATGFQRLAQSLDPAYAAQQKLAQGSATLQRALDAGKITADDHVRLLGLLQQRYGNLTPAVNDNASAMGKSTASAGQLRFAVQNLGFQLNDIATSLASGSSPFRVLAQQSGQVVQAFQQGGGISAVLGGFGRVIAGLLTPTTLAIGGIAALAAGIGVLIERASDARDNIRTFDLELRTLGTGSETTGTALQGVVTHLRDTGVAAADAKRALDLIATSPGINPASAGSITDVARQIQAQRGGDFVATVKDLTTALQGGTEGIIKYGFQLGVLTAAQAAAIRSTGDLRIGVDAIASAFPSVAESTSAAATATQKLSRAWSDFLDSLANSSIIQGAVNALTSLLQALTGTAAAITDVQQKAAEANARAAIGGVPQPGPQPQRPGYASQGPYAPIGRAAPGADPNAWPFAELPMLMAPPGGPLRADERAGNIAMGGGYPFPTLGGFTGGADRHDAASLTVPNQKDIDAVNQHRKALQEDVAVAQQFGAAAEIMAARQKATTEAEKLFTDASQRQQYVADAVAAAEAKHAAELGKQTQLADMAARGALEIVAGYDKSTVAGLQATAAVKARSDALQSGIPYEQAYARALTESADAALTSAAQSYASGQQRLAANQNIAAAAQQGVAAEREAQQQAAASAQTQDALNKARATGNQTLIDAAQKLTDQTLAQIKANEAAQAAIEISDKTHSLGDQQRILELQLSLQGQTSGEIQKQVQLLEAKQLLENKGLSTADATAQAYLKQVASIGDVTQALQEAQASQQRFDDAIRSIADTIENTIGQAIDDAFDNKKTLDWGQTLKNVLAQIVNQIAQIALIRPAIGSVLSGLGFSSAAQQFGTFGSLFGGEGVGASAVSGGGGLNTGSLLQGGGLFKDVLGQGVGGGGFLNGLNLFGARNLGFAFPNATGLSESELAGLGLPLNTPGSLFGGTTFSGFLGGAGLGFGAGSLLNSVLGGNSLGGTIGSGVGSLAGAAIGSIIPGVGTLIGGLLGGLGGGGLGGLLGGSMNYSSSATIGANGQINLSGPNQQNSQIAAQVLQGLQPLVSTLKSLGYNVPTVGATYGTKTGLQTGITGFDEKHYASQAEAIAGTSQRLLKALGAVNPGLSSFVDLLGNVAHLSPTLKDTHKSFDDLSQVFATIKQNFDSLKSTASQIGVPITDLNDRLRELGSAVIEAQISRVSQSVSVILKQGLSSLSDYISAFSDLYAKYQQALAEARAAYVKLNPIGDQFRALATTLLNPELKSALAGVTDSFKSLQVGQYAAALQQVRQVFAGIAAQATQFNIADRSPIGNTEKQAQRNLKDSFNEQIQDLILGITNPNALAIKQEKAAGEARLADARALGVSLAQVRKLNELSLQKVIAATKGVTEASGDAAGALDSLRQALREISGGSLSGLSPGKQAESAYNLFESLFKSAAWKNNPQAYAQLGTQATAAVQALQTAYGNGPIAAAFREIIQAQLKQAVQAGGAGFSTGSITDLISSILQQFHVTGFAGGTTSTPPGPILVGERGPELLYQRGGNAIVPLTPANQNQSGAVIAELRNLRSDVIALRRQMQGGQVQAHADAAEANTHLGRIKTAAVHGAAVPPRRKVA